MFTIKAKDLPEEIPVFPVSQVVLLPRGSLDLNISDSNHIKMIEDALANNRLLGIVQARLELNSSPNDAYSIGCVGRISSFEEYDNRLLLTLKGVCRFETLKDRSSDLPYRRSVVDWRCFINDLEEEPNIGANRDNIVAQLERYFLKTGLVCDKWDQIRSISDDKLVSCLTMICPFDGGEKQAILEATTLEERFKILTNLLDMSIKEDIFPSIKQ